MKIRIQLVEGVVFLLGVFACVCGILALGISCSRPEASQVAAAELRQARVDRDSATAREARVRDSAQQIVAERDAAWGLHVRDLVAMQQEELQEAARASARRARAEVRVHAGSEDLFAEAPDTGSGRPPCEVTMTCSEAAALVAADSLQRVRFDSIQAIGMICDARCSSMVSEIVVQKDSSAIIASHSADKRNKWLLTSIAVTIVEFMIIVRVLVQ